MEEIVEEEVIFLGSPISEGVASGTLSFLEDYHCDVIPEFSINSSDVEKEIGRYRRAILSSKEDLFNLQKFLAKEGSKDAVSIIDTHIQMLDDPFMTTFVEKKIRQRMKNTESVFQAVMTEYEKEFSKVKDQFFQQRLLDIKDLSARILQKLYPKKKTSIQDLPKDSIIFSKELPPSAIAEASATHIKGFITEMGGATSHAALIARSKGLPFVANLDMDILRKYNDAKVIVDGKKGTLIIHPTDVTCERYQSPSSSPTPTPSLESSSEAPTCTTDKKGIHIHANIESITDIPVLSSLGANGVGLFRTEFLFYGNELHSFSEEEQYSLYAKVMDDIHPLPVTFRVFDVGGDKGSSSWCEVEPNPALGCRGIRFLLRNREVFAWQLRALLRVSPRGKLSILLPMVSDVSELREAKELIRDIAIELRAEGHDIADDIPVGCMIEVPAAALMADLLAKECDFLSIGTNDLMQYTLATDRTAKEIYSYYNPTHPSMIKIIDQVVRGANAHSTPVNICGEMASDPLMVPLLIGLGVKSLSCSYRKIPSIRERVAKLSAQQCSECVEKLLQLETSEEVEALLQKQFGATS